MSEAIREAVERAGGRGSYPPVSTWETAAACVRGLYFFGVLTVVTGLA